MPKAPRSNLTLQLNNSIMENVPSVNVGNAITTFTPLPLNYVGSVWEQQVNLTRVVKVSRGLFEKYTTNEAVQLRIQAIVTV